MVSRTSPIGEGTLCKPLRSRFTCTKLSAAPNIERPIWCCSRGLLEIGGPQGCARRWLMQQKLIDRVATGTPIGQLLLIKALGDMRVPFAGHRSELSYRDRAGYNRCTSCSGSGGRHRISVNLRPLSRGVREPSLRNARLDVFRDKPPVLRDGRCPLPNSKKPNRWN
jgi:hypothetical protein